MDSRRTRRTRKVVYFPCCPELVRLIIPKQKSLNLLPQLLAKRGPQFILGYREDWDTPLAKQGVRIHYCPYCGTKLSEGCQKNSN
jgi:hypothetical protein